MSKFHVLDLLQNFDCGNAVKKRKQSWLGGGDLLKTKDQAIIHWPYNELVTPTTKGSSPSPQ